MIPKPASKSVAERLGLDDVNLNISLSDDTKEMLESVRSTMQVETSKTRTVLILLGCLNAVSFLIGKYAI